MTQVHPTNASLFLDYSSLSVSLTDASQLKLSTVTINSFAEFFPFQFVVEAYDSSGVIDASIFSFYKNSPPQAGTFSVARASDGATSFAATDRLSLTVSKYRARSTQTFRPAKLRLLFQKRALNVIGGSSSDEFILLDDLAVPSSTASQELAQFSLPPLSDSDNVQYEVTLSLQITDGLYARSASTNVYQLTSSYQVANPATFTTRREELISSLHSLDLSVKSNTLFAISVIESLVPSYPHSPSQGGAVCRWHVDCGGLARGQCSSATRMCSCGPQYAGYFCQFLATEATNLKSISSSILSALHS